MARLSTQADDEIVTMPVSGASNFHFSCVKPENLKALEYTLVTIVIDETGSTSSFADLLRDMVKTIVKSCQSSPRKDNIMVRVIAFNTKIREVHGFRLLVSIDPDAYDSFNPSGMTALFDATTDALGSTLTYGSTLYAKDLTINGIVFVVTDGEDNASKHSSAQSVAAQCSNAIIGEEIESLLTILIGLKNPNDPTRRQSEIEKLLTTFKDEAKLTQYIDAGEANESNLAKLANFVSQSISSQSQSLGSGVSGAITNTF